MLRKATGLAKGLVLRPERALENLIEGSLGLVFSQSVLLALVESGMSRDDAYRIVQSSARQAFEERRNFKDVIEGNELVTLGNEALARAFDAQRLLAHRGRFLDALTWRS
jgi:adenylosuccinate lyase